MIARCGSVPLNETLNKEVSWPRLPKRNWESELPRELGCLDNLLCYCPPTSANPRTGNHVFPRRPSTLACLDSRNNISEQLGRHICPTALRQRNLTPVMAVMHSTMRPRSQTIRKLHIQTPPGNTSDTISHILENTSERHFY